MESEGPQGEPRTLMKPAWSVDKGMLSVRSARRHTFAIQGLSGSITLNGRQLLLTGADGGSSCDERQNMDGNRSCTVTFRFAEPEFSWVWKISEQETPAGPALAIKAVVRNTGRSDLDLKNWNVIELQPRAKGRIDLGEEPHNVRFFGWRPWNMRVERLTREAGSHRSSNLFHLFDPVTGTTLLCGFVTLDRMAVEHELRCGGGGSVTEYRATCMPGAYRLPPGRELESETLQISYHRDPYAALDAWAERVNRIYEPTFRDKPIVCWSGSAWINAFSEREDPWETTLLECARALRQKLPNFDIGLVRGTTHRMYKGGLPGNWLEVDKRQIPSGLASLGQQLRQMGFDHKFWFSPFWFFAEAEGALEENRENLLRDADGDPITEPANWEFDHNADPDDARRLKKVYLDGTHPRTKEYLRKIFTTYRDMGVRAYMLDFLAIKEEAELYDQTLLPVEAARESLKVIRGAAGEDTHLQTAVASTPGYIGLIDSARVGRDFGEGRPLYPPFNAWRNATYALHDRHFGNAFYFVQNAAASYFTHRKIYVNDFNVLTVDKPVPLEHARIATTVFGLGGGTPLALGDDFRRIDPGRLRLVKLCLPRTQDVPVPVDLFEHVAQEDYCRILKLPVETSWGAYMVAAVFNLDQEPYATDLEFAALGLDGEMPYRVFEFWSQRYVGTFKGSCRCSIPPEACRVFRLSKAREHPWLLATDLHMQQGAVDIGSLEWDQEPMTLSGTAVRPVGEKGNIFFLMPRNLRLVNHVGTNLMKEVRDMNVVIRLPVTFGHEREDFELRFTELDTPYLTRKGWLPYATEEEWLKYVREHRNPGDTRVME
jgi:hypothetical protein